MNFATCTTSEEDISKCAFRKSQTAAFPSQSCVCQSDFAPFIASSILKIPEQVQMAIPVLGSTCIETVIFIPK